ncbi:MAG TPA: chemotaxis protein CheW [Vicinamibacterales bacterium]
MAQEGTVQTAGFTADGNQYLTFALGQEEYGVEILRVQEIKGYSAITPIPNAPVYLKGVMNLRGTVVPVVDLRAKFSMAAAEYDKFTVVIVVTVGARVFGLVVDAVSDVVNLPEDKIEPAPELGDGIDTSFLRGMARAGEKFVLLLDIERVLGNRELVEASAAA